MGWVSSPHCSDIGNMGYRKKNSPPWANICWPWTLTFSSPGTWSLSPSIDCRFQVLAFSSLGRGRTLTSLDDSDLFLSEVMTQEEKINFCLMPSSYLHWAQRKAQWDNGDKWDPTLVAKGLIMSIQKLFLSNFIQAGQPAWHLHMWTRNMAFRKMCSSEYKELEPWSCFCKPPTPPHDPTSACMFLSLRTLDTNDLPRFSGTRDWF